MSGRARIAVRAIAVAIAIAGVVDPLRSTMRPVPRELVAIVVSNRVTAATSSHGPVPALDAVVARLRDSATGWNVVVRETSGPQLPCAVNERCVVIADGSADVAIPADMAAPVSLIAARPNGEPNVELRRIVMSSTHASAAGSARIDLVRSGAVSSTEIRMIDGGAVVGAATHTWNAGPAATVEVPWWPIQTGGRVLHVEAVPMPGETAVIDNAIDAGVDVIDARASVLVFDARASWSSTFVRRALEDDPRFSVGYRARTAPSLTAGTADARLDASVLDRVAVLAVGGVDALTTGDVDLIERYVHVRGGTLVLLPEQRVIGPAERLLAGTWTEHLTQMAERVGPLYASEVLRSNPGEMATVLGRSGTMAAIVSMPAGRGRIIVSGAMDAWRYRDKDAGAFDRFWRSLIAEGAAAGAPVSLSFDRPLVGRGASVRFTIRDRRMTPFTTAEASAVLHCGDGATSTVRLWPSGSVGEFTGDAAVSRPGSCSIEATIDGRRVTGAFAVAEQPRRGVNETLTTLVTAVGARRGIVVSAGEEAELARAIEANRQPSSQVVSTRPLRSPWWMMPFAACVTLEWWLRRRDGLR